MEVTRRFHNIMSVMGPYRAKSCGWPGRESDSCQKSEPTALVRREVRDLTRALQEGRDLDYLDRPVWQQARVLNQTEKNQPPGVELEILDDCSQF